MRNFNLCGIYDAARWARDVEAYSFIVPAAYPRMTLSASGCGLAGTGYGGVLQQFFDGLLNCHGPAF